MNELIRKVIYFILSIQEKALTMRLDKSLKGSYKNKTSKTIIAGSEHMTLTSETEKNKELSVLHNAYTAFAYRIRAPPSEV